MVATKIRVLPEAAQHPSFGIRLGTRLPNASNESGLGLDTTDFFASLLAAKTVQSIRVVGNIGTGILADPLAGHEQNDVLTLWAVRRASGDRPGRNGGRGRRSRVDQECRLPRHRNARPPECRCTIHAGPDSV